MYTEIVFVLHQIIDRMDNLLNLRTRYGAGPLEEFNTELYPYRRNIAGSISATLFSIQSALATKLPLPQFMPSVRLAHLRLINKVRDIVAQTETSQVTATKSYPPTEFISKQGNKELHKVGHQRAVRRKYLAWNAASAAQAEIIEFLEELIDLTKLVVGASQFGSGLFVHCTPDEDAASHGLRDDTECKEKDLTDQKRGQNMDGAVQESPDDSGIARPMELQQRRRRGTTVTSGNKAESSGIPATLVRIQTRKREAGRRRASTKERMNESGEARVKY